MWRLIKGLITGDFHLHSWETVKVTSVEGHPSNGGGRWDRYTCRCEQCGRIKTFNTC